MTSDKDRKQRTTNLTVSVRSLRISLDKFAVNDDETQRSGKGILEVEIKFRRFVIQLKHWGNH